MKPDELGLLCLAKPGAYEDRPFGPWPVCYKVAGRIFAQVYPDKIPLKCTAFSCEAFRLALPGIVVRGCHCPAVQQPYWNTIDLSRFPAGELSGMIDHAYETVVASCQRQSGPCFPHNDFPAPSENREVPDLLFFLPYRDHRLFHTTAFEVVTWNNMKIRSSSGGTCWGCRSTPTKTMARRSAGFFWRCPGSAVP